VTGGVTCTLLPGGRSAGAVRSIGGDGADLRGAAGDSVDAPEDGSVGGVVMMAEKVSVLPSKTVPELGATVTVICGVEELWSCRQGRLRRR